MEPTVTNNQIKTAKEDGKKTKDKTTVIVFSGDLDRVLAAFIIATGAASMGMEAHMFFTFWGLNVLKKNDARNTAPGLMKKMLGVLNKGGTKRLPLSKFHMGGMGTMMMKKLMQRHKMPSIDEMLEIAKQLNVKMIACTTTMDILGISKEQLRNDYIDQYAGVVTYLSEAKEGNVNLFI